MILYMIGAVCLTAASPEFALHHSLHHSLLESNRKRMTMMISFIIDVMKIQLQMIIIIQIQIDIVSN